MELIENLQKDRILLSEQVMNHKTINIYTDGACSGNPGKGGWGAVLIYKDKFKQLSGANPQTTNNQMELTAVIEALRAIKDRSFTINMYVDSKYVIQGIEQWIFNWKKNGWKGADKKPVKNQELWVELDKLREGLDIKWNWVKGHSGDVYNEMADKLATEAIKTL